MCFAPMFDGCGQLPSFHFPFDDGGTHAVRRRWPGVPAWDGDVQAGLRFGGWRFLFPRVLFARADVARGAHRLPGDSCCAVRLCAADSYCVCPWHPFGLPVGIWYQSPSGIMFSLSLKNAVGVRELCEGEGCAHILDSREEQAGRVFPLGGQSG